MNYFEIYIEGLAVMDARRQTGMAVNEGLLYPIHETAVKIVSGVPLEDAIWILDPGRNQ